jgi:hypothetical protein
MSRNQRHKMVVACDGSLRKLYDLHADPTEARNFVGKPDTARIVARLREQLLQWYMTTQRRQC